MGDAEKCDVLSDWLLRELDIQVTRVLERFRSMEKDKNI